MFIQTEETPNPATLKFLPGRTVADSGTHDFGSVEDACASPLAQRLFAVNGVRGVLLGKDFIAVTKDDSETWPALKPSLLTAIMEHFSSGSPAVLSGVEGEAVAPVSESDVVTQIRDLLDNKIRPALAQDGGDVAFRKFEDGIVYLTLKGACAGCPSATLTLKAGVEAMLRHYVPEVREVRQVQ